MGGMRWVAVMGLLALAASSCSGEGSGESDAAAETAATLEQTTTTVDPVLEAIEAGYVAVCNDGNLSDNTDFHATCSGGDGLDTWLAPYGECTDGTVIIMSKDASCDDHDGFLSLLDPDYEPAPGAGDVARCANGLFSDNTDFGATCSANGGVDEWLAAYGECEDGTVIRMSADATCSEHGGFSALLPDDYVPETTTTAAPAMTAPPATQQLPPASLQETVFASVNDRLGAGELRSVEVAETRIVVTIRSAENITEGLTKDSARYAVSDALQGLRDSGLPPEIASVSIVIKYDLVNQFGEVSEETVIEADFSRGTLDRIVFESIDTTKILLLADVYLYVHPAFAKDDGS